MIKIFGIGNILLCDDAIGVKVAKYLQENSHRLYENTKVFIGETDYMYCLDQIEKGDKVIILDSTYFNIPPGMVTKIPLEKCDEFITEGVTSHDMNLLKTLRREYREIKGYLIGIEVESIDYGLELSDKLSEKFENICEFILKLIKEISKEVVYA